MAQAAHETGWGQREIRNADGFRANNLFRHQAPGRDGRVLVAEAVTTEVVDGQAESAALPRLRDPAESFRDYARLMKNSARYSQVLARAQTPSSYAQGLQSAGYATDPEYADKLGRVINTTLQLQRARLIERRIDGARMSSGPPCFPSARAP